MNEASQPSRHEQLIAANWRYDADQDRYTPPGKVQSGAEKWYNLDAAYAMLEQQRYEAKMARASAPGRGERQTDPRRKEPQ